MRKIILILGVTLLGCNEKAPEVEPPVSVHSESIVPSVIMETITLMGSANSSNEVVIYAKTSETVEKLLVQPGQKVTKDQVLAKLSNRSQTESVRQSGASLENVKIQLETAAKEFQRAKSLYLKNAITEQQYAVAETNFKTTQSARLTADAVHNQSLEVLSHTILRSPMSGIVAMVHVREGDLTQPMKSVFKIINPEHLQSDLYVPEKEVSRIRMGQEVIAGFASTPGESFSGKVINMDQAIDPATRTLKIKVAVETNDKVKAGSFGTFQLVVYKNDSALAVPSHVIRREFSLAQKQAGNETAYLYVTQEGRAHKRPVTLGISKDGFTEVLSGIEKGDSLIINGYHLVEDSSVVAVQKI